MPRKSEGNRIFRYDFDLKTGKSETGLRACTYAVQLRTDPESGVEKVYMETPEGGSHWRLVELRPVSEGGFDLYLRICLPKFIKQHDFTARFCGSTSPYHGQDLTSGYAYTRSS